MGFSALIRTSDASAEPISLAEAKAFLRVDHDDEDELISSLITAARQWAEDLTGRGFLEQTWVMKLDRINCRVIEIPRAPLMEVTSITYLDSDGESQTVATSDYQVDLSSEPGRVRFDTLPSTGATYLNAVTFTYTVGYGASASAVPQAIKAAIKFVLGAFYDRRSADESVIPVAARNLLNPHKVWTFEWAP